MASGEHDGSADGEESAARFDRDFWDGRWSEVLRDHAAKIVLRPPNAYLTVVAGGLAPGRALDAGCGNGTEALWLATRGWRVTAVDFSAPALAHGRSIAEGFGSDVAGRLEWVEGDLGVWTPAADHYDLVSSLYVHVAGAVGEMVARLAAGVAPGGMLLLVGHLPLDPLTGAETPAAGQVQVTVEEAVAVLDASRWDVSIGENRARAVAGSGFDAVICRATSRVGASCRDEERRTSGVGGRGAMRGQGYGFPAETCIAGTGSCFTGLGHGYSDCNVNGKEPKMIGAGGLVVSVIAFGVGAILDWAVTEPYQHGFNINKVGWILMIVGVVGAILSIIVMVVGNMRRSRTVVDDGRGNVVRRVDSTY